MKKTNDIESAPISHATKVRVRIIVMNKFENPILDIIKDDSNYVIEVKEQLSNMEPIILKMKYGTGRNYFQYQKLSNEYFCSTKAGTFASLIRFSMTLECPADAERKTVPITFMFDGNSVKCNFGTLCYLEVEATQDERPIFVAAYEITPLE
ncbi:hypothetical protein PV327_009721 [Microctonus hyperodae]|uniref:Uncharacterized protein n=1 Tax=Microctonus hyperodae TaxID=165561 RepID=A0AA39CB28_MICHY|nr:hypothetical protein PV327_009721 [Microctonus hyperodae]